MVPLDRKSNNTQHGKGINRATTNEGEQTKFTITERQKKAFKSYCRAVLASAVTLGLALAADLAPQYAIAIGAVFGPLAKWADSAEKDFGR